MLFTSPEFIYFFLPFTLFFWWLLIRIGWHDEAQSLIVVCSVYFYGWWDMTFVPLLMGQTISNFYLGKMLAKHKSKTLLVASLVYNIGVLAYFKYANFFIENWNELSSTNISLLHSVLPLGLSFFTFQVLAFLVDCYNGRANDFDLRRFAFSVSFFPHLIAGPILHYSDVMPQLRHRISFDARLFSQGLLLFTLGLFKKNVIADHIAEQVDPLFAADTALPFFESWTAAIGYGLQIYFDFSAYSDMAIGIGFLFGVTLPQNFNSPYQAKNIAEFWTRWHMTLSRFLRDYVYIPLGGNRFGFARGIVAATITMAIGGFWHGAAWTFVLWGLLHGLLIGIHRVWRQFELTMATPFAITLTFLSVTVAWVLFRAESLSHALSIWNGMVGGNGFTIPPIAIQSCPTCKPSSLITGMELLFDSVLIALCLTAANAYAQTQRLQPTLKYLAVLTTLLFTSIWMSGSHENFIYWQF